MSEKPGAHIRPADIPLCAPEHEPHHERTKFQPILAAAMHVVQPHFRANFVVTPHWRPNGGPVQFRWNDTNPATRGQIVV